MRTGRWLVLGLVGLCTACASMRLPSAGVTVAPAPMRAATLQVPYIAQSVLLCGGAAIAMIERWWGRRGVYAEDFAALVRPEEGGIRTTDLAAMMSSRGWMVQALETTGTRVRLSLAHSVPVIALIRVAERRYHYVVILGWNDDGVTYHDPAVSPSMTVDTATFMKRWRGAKRWALFARPGAAPSTPVVAVTTQPVVDSLPCRPWLDKAADAAMADRLDDAEQLLDTARAQCPSEPLVLRELAGVRFRQRRTADAVRLATEYSQRAPFDTLGWQLLASSHYLAGNTRRALGAWNRIGQPRIDLLRIDGSSHARFRELAASLDMPAGGLLTPKRYALARRRIADVPSLSRARVDYTIVDDGVAEVRAAVVERPVIAPLRQLLVRGAVDAAIRRDASLTLFSPLGFGESWSAQWRWQSADPRVAVRLSIPARIGIPTVVRLERSWETYRFSAGLAEEQRSVAAVNLAGWTHPLVDVLLGARLENWSDRGENIVASGGVGLHDTDDHVALLIEGERAVAREGGTPYDRLRWRGLWTPPADRWRNTWSLRIGTDWTSATTPLGLQPLAAGDLGRDIPLRAHPYIIDGALPSRRIARAITHGGVSADRAVGSRGPLTLAAGIFLDAAHLMSAADGLPRARTYLDAGAGVRIGTSASSWSAVRIDVARGLLSDRRWGISAGLAPQWPARLGRARDRR